jgi:hypothetical protein
MTYDDEATFMKFQDNAKEDLKLTIYYYAISFVEILAL